VQVLVLFGCLCVCVCVRRCVGVRVGKLTGADHVEQRLAILGTLSGHLLQVWYMFVRVHLRMHMPMSRHAHADARRVFQAEA